MPYIKYAEKSYFGDHDYFTQLFNSSMHRKSLYAPKEKVVKHYRDSTAEA